MITIVFVIAFYRMNVELHRDIFDERNDQSVDGGVINRNDNNLYTCDKREVIMIMRNYCTRYWSSMSHITGTRMPSRVIRMRKFNRSKK